MIKKILIIDPDSDARFRLRVFLRRYQIEILEAKDKMTALDLCMRRFPDCIVVEYLMPDADGAEFIRAIRGVAGTTPMLVIAQQGFELQMRQLPVQACLTKPFDQRTFVEALSALVGHLEEKTDDAASPAPPVTRPETARKKILIAEDDQELHTLYMALLEKDYDVLIVNNGIELIDSAQKENPDLIITDIIMPGLSGYKAVQQVRASGLTHTPVIFCSGLVKDKELYETLKPAGPSTFIMKPFNKNDFLDIIKTLLAHT